MDNTITELVLSAHTGMCKTGHSLDDDGGGRCYRLPSAEAQAGHGYT